MMSGEDCGTRGTYHKRKEGSINSNISGRQVVRDQEHPENEMLVQFAKLTKVLGLFEATRGVAELLAGECQPLLNLQSGGLNQDCPSTR